MQEYPHEYASHWFHFPTPIEKTAGLCPIRAGHNRAKPNFKIGPRVITYFSLHFVLNGEGTIIQGDKMMPLKAGDLFCLFPNMTNHYYTDPDNPLELFWLAFEGKQAVSLINRIGLSSDSYLIDNIVNKEILSVLQELEDHFTQDFKHDELHRMSIIYKLLHHIYTQTNERNLVPNSSLSWIKKSVRYMDMHFTEDISVKDVAKYIGIHRSYFTTSFVKDMGITPVQYLIKLKMDRALEMLAEQSHTITEIAYSLGYSDLYSFSRAFKNYHGISPKQYIRKINKG